MKGFQATSKTDLSFFKNWVVAVNGIEIMKFSSLGSLLRMGPQRILLFFYHLPNFLRLFWRLLKDWRVGLLPKGLLILVLAYTVIPLDFLPDFVPALGQIDDLLVIFLGMKGFVRLCPPDVVREHVKAIGAGR
jgi:uncharacterized membrane protein YkvA (DUF1232 family)